MYDIRDRKRSATLRTNLRLTKLRSKKAATPSSTASSATVKSFDNITGAHLAQAGVRGADYATVSKLTALRERILRAARYNSRRRQGQSAPRLSGCTVGRTMLQRVSKSSEAKKQKAL